MLVKDIQEWVKNNYGHTPSITTQVNKNGVTNYRVYFSKKLFRLLTDMYLKNTISMDRKQYAFRAYYEYRIKNL